MHYCIHPLHRNTRLQFFQMAIKGVFAHGMQCIRKLSAISKEQGKSDFDLSFHWLACGVVPKALVVLVQRKNACSNEWMDSPRPMTLTSLNVNNVQFLFILSSPAILFSLFLEERIYVRKQKQQKNSQSFCAESSGIPQKAQSPTIVKWWKGWNVPRLTTLNKKIITYKEIRLVYSVDCRQTFTQA